MFKVVYIDYNFIDDRYPNNVNDGDRFFTYGFGSIYARKFKKYNPDVNVECWKADSRIKKTYEKQIENVDYKIFPSIKIGKLGHYSKSMLRHLSNELGKNEKIIFNISSFRHLLFYSVALKLKNTPLVVQHHGEASAIYKTKINKGLKKLFYALQVPFEKLAFKNINLLFVLDDRIKEFLPKGNRNLQIEVSTTGVDEEIFYPLDKTQAKKNLGWDINKKHILYVGRLNFTKRTDLLLEIFAELKKEGRKDIELILAGTEKDDILYRKAKSLGAKIYPKVLITELYKFLSAADLYTIPKYKRDMPFLGIGMLPVQAMFCETPVVGDSLSTFPSEDVEQIGFCSSEKAQIKQRYLDIIDEKVRFKNLREIAIKYYSWENIAKRTYLFYSKILELK